MNTFDFSSDAWSGLGASGEYNADVSAVDLYACKKESLYDSLERQINMNFKDESDRKTAALFIEFLDEKGFLNEESITFVNLEKKQEMHPLGIEPGSPSTSNECGTTTPRAQLRHSRQTLLYACSSIT